MQTLIPILIVILFGILLLAPPRKAWVWIGIVVVVAIGTLVFSDISLVFHALWRNTVVLFGDLFGHYDGVVTLAISSALALLSYWLISKLLFLYTENRTVIVYASWIIAGAIAGLSVYQVRGQFAMHATRMAIAALPAALRDQDIVDPIYQNTSIVVLGIDALSFLSISISGGCAGIAIARYRSIKGSAILGVVGLTLGELFQFIGLTLGVLYLFDGPPPTIRRPQTILVVATLLAPTVLAILLLVMCKLIGKTKAQGFDNTGRDRLDGVLPSGSERHV
jgi:hypothetical protein